MEPGALPVRATVDSYHWSCEQLTRVGRASASRRAGGAACPHHLRGVRHRRPAHHVQNCGRVPHAGLVLLARSAALHVLRERHNLLEARHAYVAPRRTHLRLLNSAAKRGALAFYILPARRACIPHRALECARAYSDYMPDRRLRARLRLPPLHHKTKGRNLSRLFDRY